MDLQPLIDFAYFVFPWSFFGGGIAAWFMGDWLFGEERREGAKIKRGFAEKDRKQRALLLKPTPGRRTQRHQAWLDGASKRRGWALAPGLKWKGPKITDAQRTFYEQVMANREKNRQLDRDDSLDALGYAVFGQMAHDDVERRLKADSLLIWLDEKRKEGQRKLLPELRLDSHEDFQYRRTIIRITDGLHSQEQVIDDIVMLQVGSRQADVLRREITKRLKYEFEDSLTQRADAIRGNMKTAHAGIWGRSTGHQQGGRVFIIPPGDDLSSEWMQYNTQYFDGDKPSRETQPDTPYAPGGGPVPGAPYNWREAEEKLKRDLEEVRELSDHAMHHRESRDFWREKYKKLRNKTKWDTIHGRIGQRMKEANKALRRNPLKDPQPGDWFQDTVGAPWYRKVVAVTEEEVVVVIDGSSYCDHMRVHSRGLWDDVVHVYKPKTVSAPPSDVVARINKLEQEHERNKAKA